MRGLLGAAAAAMALIVGLGGAAQAAPAEAAPSVTRYLGMFREQDAGTVAGDVRADYGVTPASVMWFDSWATRRPFPVETARAMWAGGVVPHYTWEPWDPALGPTAPGQITLQDVVAGDWDGYITARAAEFKQYGGPLMVRWGHEFNGNWYPWGVANNGNDPRLYVRAYRHVHDLVTKAGAKNVQWVWAYNNGSSPNLPFNDPVRAYPGPQYVDWVGIDGYNWGAGPSWDPAGDHWTSFLDTFHAAYRQARTVAPDKPVMLGEFASTEDGGSKAAWIRAMDEQLRAGRFPDLKLLTWFDTLKEEPWAAGSSPGARDAFRDWVHRGNMDGPGRQLAKVAGRYAERS